MTGLRMDSRIAQRRAEVRHERMLVRRRRTLVAIAVAAVVAVGVAIERSPLVALAAVEVEGASTVAAEEVRAAADLPLGTSTLRLRLGAAAERVEELPAVREATARRIDPLTVRVEVVERRPLVVLRSAGGQALLDRDGIVVSYDDGRDLPTIEVTTEDLPAPGESVSENAVAANAFAFHRTLPGPLRSEVASYLARGPDELDLLLERGAVARLGRAHRIPEKARALGALLDDLPTEPGWTLDVRAPTNPVVVPPGAAEEPEGDT